MCSVELHGAEFESEAQFCRRHLRIGPQQFIECWLPIPRATAIAHIKVISQCLTTKVDGGNTQVGAANFGRNEQVVTPVVSGLCGVADLGLKNAPPSLLRMGLVYVDLCGCVGCFMFQREKQFVASANERRQEIRDQDGSPISKNALCLDAFRICPNDLPLAQIWFDLNRRTHFVADSSTLRAPCQISGPFSFKSLGYNNLRGWLGMA